MIIVVSHPINELCMGGGGGGEGGGGGGGRGGGDVE